MIASELASFDRRKGSVIALSFLPPVAVGLALERQIEENLGGPFQTAIGLLAGAAAMALADQRPKHRSRARAGTPRRPRARCRTGLRAGPRRLAKRRDPDRRPLAGLRPRAREHALANRRPAGHRRAPPCSKRRGCAAAASLREHRAAFVAGTATSFASTLASQALIGLVERDSALWPYSAYRAGLAAVVLARLAAQAQGRAGACRGHRRRRTTATATRRPGRDAASAAEQVARSEDRFVRTSS